MKPDTRVPWTLGVGSVIYLLTPEQYAALPDGTEVVSIMNEKKIKGKDYIDDDTRGGYLAYGLPHGSELL
jgi:hypothetical protein